MIKCLDICFQNRFVCSAPYKGPLYISLELTSFRNQFQGPKNIYIFPTIPIPKIAKFPTRKMAITSFPLDEIGQTYTHFSWSRRARSI